VAVVRDVQYREKRAVLMPVPSATHNYKMLKNQQCFDIARFNICTENLTGPVWLDSCRAPASCEPTVHTLRCSATILPSRHTAFRCLRKPRRHPQWLILKSKKLSCCRTLTSYKKLIFMTYGSASISFVKIRFGLVGSTTVAGVVSPFALSTVSRTSCSRRRTCPSSLTSCPMRRIPS
jgi:hypothetical protein